MTVTINKIAINKKQRYSPSFTSKVERVHQGTLPKELFDMIDEFEETHKNADDLGQGLFAKAYHLNGTRYAIKESLDTKYAKEKNDRFYPEAKFLQKIPSSMSISQQLVANVETENKNFYLITTLMDGEPRKANERPWDENSFKSLFKSLFQLDEAEIYHNDLNESNILIDKNNNANILDYQFGTTFIMNHHNDDYMNGIKLKFPSFMMPANAQMFEMASLPYYFDKSKNNNNKNELRNSFRDYLNTKSVYCRDRALYLKENENKVSDVEYKMEYELLQSKYYKNPSDDIIDLQALKLQIMFAHRKTFSIIDPNGQNDKNIFLAVPSYINTANCAAKMERKARQLKEKAGNDDNLKRFLRYEERFASFWKNTMLTELNGGYYDFGVYKWIQGNASGISQYREEKQSYYDEYEHSYVNAGTKYIDMDPDYDLQKKIDIVADMEFEKIDNISDLLINEKVPVSLNNSFDLALKDIKQDSISINKHIAEYCENNTPPEKFDVDLIELELLKEKYIDSCNKMHHGIEKQELNKAIPNSMRAAYYGKLINQYIYRIEYLTNKASEIKNYAKKQKEIVQSKELNTISTGMVYTMSAALDRVAPEKILENINDFEIKNYPKYNFLKMLP